MRRAAIAAAGVLVALCVARADVLHLQGGGTIEADRWWIEGDTLHVESDGGTVGIPKTMLLKVETTAAKPKPEPKRDASKSAPRPTLKHADADVAAKMAEGNAALSARDFDTATIKFYEVISEQPGAPGPRVGYALAEMALGRDAQALPVVLDGLARTPDSADLHEVLGSLRDREERVEDALTEWREAFKLAPSDRLKDKIQKAERELTAARGYEYTPAAHFTLRYDGALDQDLVASITDYLEDRFRSLTTLYRNAPTQPITVLLYPQQAFYDVTQAGHEVVGLYDGKIRAPLGGLKRLSSEAQRVLIHELTHAFVAAKTRGNCPRWLQEGLAQMAEPRSVRRPDLAALARDVRPRDPATWPDAAFSYPAALSFTKFLEARRGFDLLVDLLARLGDGDKIDTALSETYSASFAELCAEWAESLHTEPNP